MGVLSVDGDRGFAADRYEGTVTVLLADESALPKTRNGHSSGCWLVVCGCRVQKCESVRLLKWTIQL